MPEDPPEQPLRVFRHEAGTPLAVIGGALRQLDRTDVSADQRQLLRSALRQWEVLQRLLDQLHVADAEELAIERQRLDLTDLVTEVVGDLDDTVLADHACSVEAPEHPLVVAGDPTRLRQVLVNLLDNAAKYSPADTAIHVTLSEDGGRSAVVAVTDEGTGISEPDAVRVFERWERASQDTDGLGLGLYVVWRIVEAHGGNVSAEPAPDGPGARFVVRLPALDR